MPYLLAEYEVFAHEPFEAAIDRIVRNRSIPPLIDAPPYYTTPTVVPPAASCRVSMQRLAKI